MEIKCNCGNIICKGNIRTSKRGKEVLDIEGGKVQGEIWHRGSNNPRKWIGICTDCQKKLNKKKKIGQDNIQKDKQDSSG